MASRLISICTLLGVAWVGGSAETTSAAEPSLEETEDRFLTGIRQLTFQGRRAGEGYYSRDGRTMVFQSEREPGNPFFQIYLLDLAMGDIERVSTGRGKTTCAWIFPDNNRVLFASTHLDPQAQQKQRDELALRAQGRERRYAWDYDEQFELFAYHRDTGEYQQLTHARGYDAEGSCSPDGQWIVFASNRHAYDTPLEAAAAEKFRHDPSWLVDLYRMKSDGSLVERLTEQPGYDGGPFFSSDGTRICFRRFSEDGATAEILTVKADGSDERQLTRLGAMSWAPYYHPSGQYLIFTTNLHGFANFELYLVDAEGQSPPVRVTTAEGFDGLPSFSPDGTQITWTSRRAASKQSQIFLATWNHGEALRRLALDDVPTANESPARLAAEEAAESTSGDVRAVDLIRHVTFLCRPELEGRMTGTAGERLATAYVAEYLQGIGLQPAGDDGSYFQAFDYTAGVALGPENELDDGLGPLEVDRDWRPLAFSETGEVPASPIVFAGYGLVAPAEDSLPAYDSYVHLDVEDKWVLVFRFLPEDISPEQRQRWVRYSSLRYKAMVARDRGARGLIVVPGTTSPVRNELVKLQFDGSLGDSALPVISVTNNVAARWLAQADLDLTQQQQKLDPGEPQLGVEVSRVRLRASINIEKVHRTGRNVLARLCSAESDTSSGLIVLGAHVDHLGRGGGGASLARDDEEGQIHFGADDNASGVAAMLEIAQYLAEEKRQGRLNGHHDLLVAAWSGEELGLLGSAHFAKHWLSQSSAGDTLYPQIGACLNLDMVGRMDKRLVLQGIGSSEAWRGEIERRNAPVGLPITLQNDGYLPTDASTFYTRGVPILSAFTGSHTDYHTPRDTPEKLDYESAAKIARLMALVTRSLLLREDVPDYVPPTESQPRQRRAYMRAYLGTIPDYAESETPGVKLSGVAAGGPASQCGVLAGDVIVGLAGKEIANIYDYTYALEALKVGEPVKMVVLREDERITLEVVPGSRE